MGNLNIEYIKVGILSTNCYFIWDDDYPCETIIIDPGGDFEIIINFLKNHNLVPKYIINTHGHADHIICNDGIKKIFADVKVLIGEKDKDCLFLPEKNLSNMIGLNIKLENPDILLNEKKIISFQKNHNFKVLETPGHSEGSICLILDDKYLFSGDTLFKESVGRTDFPYSSSKDLFNSLEKLKSLDKNYIVYPGHGEKTTLDYEKKNNPYFNNFFNEY